MDLDVGEVAQRRGAQVDRRRAAPGSHRPRRVEELLRRPHEIGRSRPHPFGVTDDDVRAGRQLVEQQRHLLDEHGGERLHALDGLAATDRVQQLTQLRVLGEQRRRLALHVLGEQQLAARRRPQPVLGDLERALVGHLEVADLLDLVTPELHAQRVFLGGREDVQDAAAHGEVAALLDELGAGVTGSDEVGDDVGQFQARIARVQFDRHQLAQPRHLRLQQRARRRHDHRQRSGGRVGVRARRRVGEAAQHGQAPAHGVRAR